SVVADSVYSLTSLAAIEIYAGSLSLAAASAIHNNLALTGGTVAGTGDLTITGMLTGSRGTLAGSGTVYLDGSSSIAGLELSRPLVNNGPMTLSWLNPAAGVTMTN